MFTVGELARLTGVTVRALHHYDELGLVVPSERTAAGYRLYAHADVRRLQQVLLFKELGVPLEDIPAAIAGGDLQRHRDALVEKRARIDRMIAALDAYQGDKTMSDDVQKMFDGFRDEAEQTWGHTDAWKESAKRTATYGPAEWAELQREADDIYRRLAAKMPVFDAEVAALVEEHRVHLDRWFYPCSQEMHRKVSELYVGDPRFQANLDKVAPGFARYLHDAIAIG